MVTPHATVDDLLKLFETPPTKAERLERLEDLLSVAAEELRDELGGVDYLRHPDSGETSWLVDGSGTCMLHLHRGVVSLSLIEISFDYGVTFTALEATDWALQWDAWTSDAPPDGEPYFHLVLLRSGNWRTLPRGSRTIRLTGVHGWAEAPRVLIESECERSRQIAYADPSYEGVVAGDPQFGQPSVTSRWPDELFKFLRREQRRFASCEI